MKRFINILILCFLQQLLFAEGDSLNQTKSIFIINSYRPDVEWSNNLSTSIENQLRNTYPNNYIVSDFLGISNLTISGLITNLRAIFQSFSGNHPLYPVEESYSLTTMFQVPTTPDLLIFVGSESLLFYQSYSFLMTDKWLDTPIIWVGIGDSTISTTWNINISDKDFMQNKKSENRRFCTIIRSNKTLDTYHSLEIAKENVTIEKEFRYSKTLKYTFNLTGVENITSVENNLLLIKKLIPNVNEIVFVDADYYSTQYFRWLLRRKMPEILPDVKFSDIIHVKNINTDSIHNLMLNPVEGKVFLTLAMNIDARFSKRTEEEVDSLFSHCKIAPIFSLSDRNFDNNYLIGGYSYPIDSIANQTVELSKRILNGEKPNDIPFVELKSGRVKLNKTAIVRHHLEKKANKIPDVVYVNFPPTFFEKYETNIIVILILSIILIGIIIYIYRRRVYNKKIEKEGREFQRLYNHLRTIYDNATFSFGIYDKKGTLIRLESKLLENESKDVLCTQLFNSPYLTVREKLQISNGQGITKEITCKNCTYQFIVKPLEKTILAITANITPIIDERKQKINLISFLEFVFEISKVGMAYYDLESKQSFATETWYHNMNVTHFDFSSAYQYVAEQDRQSIIEYVEKIKNGEHLEPFKKEIQVLKNDTTQWLLFHIFSMPGRNLIVELCVDLTEYKLYENKLKIAHAEAEISNNETNSFLANISHEIRTPLNAIVGFTNILSIESSNDDIDYNKIYKIIKTSITLLEDIVDNVLKLSEIDSQNTLIKTTNFDAVEMLSNIATSATSKVNSKTKIIKSFPDQKMIIDTNVIYFNQLMMNLVSNAIKFTSEGSITIGCKKEKNLNYFFVADTGCGIDEESKEMVFKRFFKANTFTQGTGLGLSLCKSIAEYLGGKLSFESELGKGSTFWFTLPDNITPDKP